MKYILLITVMLGLLFSQKQEGFNSYWYSGKAEMNSYTLDQYRYKEHHNGEAVLIFVTEDFKKDLHVKHEAGEKTNTDVILKLNRQRRFYTGVYSYTMMTSVFRPIWGEKPYKLTHSSQDWCGQSFIQMNLDGENYNTQLRSYFQNEGDQNETIEATLLEDDLYTQIRLNYNSIPTGKVKLIPSLVSNRFTHIPLQPYAATITQLQGETLKTHRNLNATFVNYDEIPRSVKIYFEKNFPNRIIGWEESINGKTTTAIIKQTIQLDYWSKNSNSDNAYKKQLMLE